MRITTTDNTPIQKAIAAVLAAFKNTDTLEEIAPEAMGVCVQKLLENVREWDKQSYMQGIDYCSTAQSLGASFFMDKDVEMKQTTAEKGGCILAATAHAILRISSFDNSDDYAAALTGQKIERWIDYGEGQQSFTVEDQQLYEAVGPYAEKAYKNLLRHPRLKAGVDEYFAGDETLPDDALDNVVGSADEAMEALAERHKEEERSAEILIEQAQIEQENFEQRLEEAFQHRVQDISTEAIKTNDLEDMKVCEAFVDMCERKEHSDLLYKARKTLHTAIAEYSKTGTINIAKLDIGQLNGRDGKMVKAQ